MAHTLAMRATSLVASAAILGVALIAALSAKYMVDGWSLPEGVTELSITDPPKPPDPPPPRPVENPRPIENTVLTDDFQPLTPTTTSDPVTTTLPVVVSTGPVSISDPRWLQRPNNLTRYYPRRAIERGVEGFVLLDCLVGTSGRLNCSVMSETPTGWQFGEAALRIAGDHRMAPAMRDGVAVEGRYRMRVPFELNN